MGCRKGFTYFILTIALALGLVAGVSAQIVSLDFSDGDATTMEATETAGVEPAQYWNGTGTTTNGTFENLVDNSGNVTTISLTTSGVPNTWRTNIADDPGNNRMMKGYLDGGDGEDILVTFSGIPYASYDVIIYVDSDGGQYRTGGYTIVNPDDSSVIIPTRYVRDPGGTHFNGEFIEVPQTSTTDLGDSTPAGNYTVMSQVNASSFQIVARGASWGDARRAPMNGIQIVSTGGFATNPSPSDGEPLVSPDAVLTWDAPTAVTSPTYELRISTDPNLANVTPVSLSTESYDPDIDYANVYYWRVDVIDGDDTYVSKTWSFSTAGLVTDPVPGDGYGGIGLLPELAWTGDEYAGSYDVYFGTNPAALSLVANVTDPCYAVETELIEYTKYYWKVVEKSGTVDLGDGDVWSFTTEGLVAQYSFENETTPAEDVTGNGNDGTSVGTISTADGILGKAAQFDGVADNTIDIPAMNLYTNQMTIMAWIKTEGLQNGFTGYVFCRGGNTTAGLHAGDGDTNQLRYTWNDDGNTWGWNSGLLVPDGIWTHAAVVISPDNAVMYMNGVEVSVNDVTHTMEEFNADWKIGVDVNDSAARAFVGLMDDVRIYTKALSAEDIIAAMEATPIAKFPIPENNMIDVPLDQELSWTAGPGAFKYKVYFGTEEDPNSNPSTEVVDPTFAPTMDLNTTYYWTVHTLDATGNVLIEGPTWNFTTIPPQAYQPDPSNSKTEVSIDKVLGWSEPPGVTNRSLYIGTDPADLSIAYEDIAGTSLDPDLDWQTTYYWRVDVTAGGVVYEGNVWSFTTIVPVCDGEAVPADLNGDCYVNLLDFNIMASNWMACGWVPEAFCN